MCKAGHPDNGAILQRIYNRIPDSGSQRFKIISSRYSYKFESYRSSRLCRYRLDILEIRAELQYKINSLS